MKKLKKKKNYSFYSTVKKIPKQNKLTMQKSVFRFQTCKLREIVLMHYREIQQDIHLRSFVLIQQNALSQYATNPTLRCQTQSKKKNMTIKIPQP